MLSLVITLLITPVAYSLFDDLGGVGERLRARSRALGCWLGSRVPTGRRGVR